MSCHSKPIVWRLLGFAFLSAALAIAVAVARKNGLIPPSLRWVGALLPVAPILGYFAGLSSWIRSLDELQRLIQLEALFIQFAITAVLIMAYGALAEVRVVPDIAASRLWPWLWLSLFVSWAFGQAMIRRKYV
jgi:hypothetical protein